MSKKDRASLLSGSLKSSMASESTAVDDRFRAAEEALARSGGNLMAASGTAGTAPVPTRQPGTSTEHAGGAGWVEAEIDLVEDNPENSRDSYPEDEISELAELIRQQGQLEPAHAMPHPSEPGRWILLSGHKRKRALIRAAVRVIKLIPTDYVAGMERYKLSLAYNTHSRETAYDNARSWSKLLEAGYVRTYDELADQLAISKSLLSKTLAFNKLPETVLAKVREHPRKFGPAAGQLLSQIAQHADEDKLMSLVEGVLEDRVTVRQLEAEATRAGQPKKARKAKVNSRQYRIHEGEAEIGILKDWDHGRVLLEVNLQDPKRRLALIDVLKRELHIDLG